MIYTHLDHIVTLSPFPLPSPFPISSSPPLPLPSTGPIDGAVLVKPHTDADVTGREALVPHHLISPTLPPN